MSQATVSVIIPVYNAERTIRRTLESLLKQEFSSWQALIIDDCSTDDTHEIIRAVVEGDPRFTVLCTSQNSGGPATPRNMGLARSTSRYVAFLDQDDIWYRDKLALQVRALASQQACKLSFSVLMPAEKRWSKRSLSRKLRTLIACRSRGRLFTEGNFIHCSSVVADREALLIAGGFPEDPDLVAAEDYVLWLHVATHSPLLFVAHVSGIYQVHSSSTSAGLNMATLSERARCAAGSGITPPPTARCGPVDRLRQMSALLLGGTVKRSHPLTFHV